MPARTGSTFGRKDGWGQSGNLITGIASTVVTMQADFEEPGTYTAQFSIGGAQQQFSVNSKGKIGGGGANPGTPNNNPIFANALITWGVEGQFVSRLITIADGASISGVGQSIKIIMMDATPSTLGANTGVQYGVAVQVSKGPRGTSKQPPILIPFGTPSASAGLGLNGGGLYVLAAGGFVNVPIPQNAGVISAYVTVVGAAGPMAQASVEAGFSYQGTIFKAWDPRDYPDWVPITPGADSLKLQGNASAGTTWSVAFGIDG